MTAAEAIHAFWAKLGIPVYEENSVPPRCAFPFFTYRYGAGDRVELEASLWLRSPSLREVREWERAVSALLPCGGVLLPHDEGGVWLTRGTPFSMTKGDGEDRLLKRILFRVTARFYP